MKYMQETRFLKETGFLSTQETRFLKETGFLSTENRYKDKAGQFVLTG
jgi:hypothetical protein